MRTANLGHSRLVTVLTAMAVLGACSGSGNDSPPGTGMGPNVFVTAKAV